MHTKNPTPSADPGASRVVAFFDLDKTVLARSSALAFGKPFLDSGLITHSAAAKLTYHQLMFLFTGPGIKQLETMRSDLGNMIAGWDADRVREVIAEAIPEVVEPLIYPEAVELINHHRALGHEVAIISASAMEIIEPIARKLGATVWAGTIMEIHNQYYTGEVTFFCRGSAKVTAMRDIAVDLGVDLADCYAYSDSHTDLPMLAAVGHPTVVNPDAKLRRIARENSWPTLTFGDSPVPKSAVQAAGLAVTTAALAGAAWLASRASRN